MKFVDTGAVRVIGPYPVDFTDFAASLSKVLFTPPSGTFVVGWVTLQSTYVVWDNSFVVYLACDNDYESTNAGELGELGGSGTGIADGTFLKAIDLGYVTDRAGLQVYTPMYEMNGDPIRAVWGAPDVSDPPSVGHVDLYVSLLTPAAP